MLSRTRKIGLAATAALGCAVAPALAEPAFNTTLSSSTTSYAWEGNPGTGFNKAPANEQTPCGSPNHDCEDILVKLDVAGALTAEIVTPSEPDNEAEATGNMVDLDLQLYKSNAAGEPGDILASTNSESAQEKVSKKGLPAGFYIVRVDFYRAQNTGYSGTIKLDPATSSVAPQPAPTAPVAAAPAPASSAPAAPAPATKPAPASAPAKKKAAACKKKAKKIKNAKKRKAALKRCGKKR
jgi:hypothetical protein